MTSFWRARVTRTRKLLEALSFAQTPVLIGENVGNRPVFGHLGASEESSDRPNADRRGGQIDPSGKNGNARYVEYEFVVDDKVIARVVATSNHYVDGHNDMKPNTEYWQIDGDSLLTTTGILKEKHIYAKKRKEGGTTDTPSFNGKHASFECDVNVTWERNDRPRHYHESNHSGFRIDVKKESGKWTGFMHFFNDGSGQLFKHIDVGHSVYYQTRDRTPTHHCLVESFNTIT